MAAKIKGRTDVWRGPLDVIEDNGTVTRYQSVWHGPFGLLKASAPKKGDTLPGFGLATVSNVRLVKEEGTYGSMTVSLEYYPAETVSVLLKDTLEIDQILIERPLLDHPVLTANDAVMALDIARWRDCPDQETKRAWYYFDESGAEQQLTDTEVKWARKLLKGVETFKDYVPLIRRRRIYSGRPSGLALCGFIDDPPASISGVSSYLKTADNAVEDENGNWTRTEEWTGASGGWDTDIYAPGVERAMPRFTPKQQERV